MKTMHRFFLPEHLLSTLKTAECGTILKITDTELIHQWSRVLRLKANDQIILLDNTEKVYECSVVEITKQHCLIKIEKIRKLETEPRKKVTIYQAIPKQLEKLEFVIQKGTELGADTFVPLVTERTQLRTISPQKMVRLKTIAKEAAEQSERTHWPKISNPKTITEAIAEITKYKPHELLLCTDARENKNQLKEFETLLRDASEISIFIGPEGGLTSQEIDLLKQEGAQCVQLGPRILRTETTAPALLAALFVGGLIE